MSVYATAWAKRQRVAHPSLKLVLLTIADYADEDGLCWPSQRRLASDTGLTERTIRRALKALEAVGVVSREKRVTRPDGTRQTDFLRLNMPPDTLSAGGSATGHGVRNHRTPCPPNHHRNHQSYPPSQGEDLSGKGGVGAAPHAEADDVLFPEAGFPAVSLDEMGDA